MLETFPKALQSREAPDFLAGGGEMGERMRTHAWARTSLGTPEAWPQSLRHAVRLLLASPQPLSLWWGPSLTHLYNDACVPLLARDHPAALGVGARGVWSEAWPQMGGRAEAALALHQGCVTPPLRFIVAGRERELEAHFTAAATPVRGEHGDFGGVLWTFADATDAVLREREMQTLARLWGAVGPATELREACVRACDALGFDRSDFPFAAIYVIDAARREARLAASAGVQAGSEALPEAVMVGRVSPWPFAHALASSEVQLVRLDDPRFSGLSAGPWDRACRDAVVAPAATSDGSTTVVLVAGLNPYRRFDAEYQRFVAQVAGIVARGVERIRLGHAERERHEARTRAIQLERSERELKELDRRKNEFLATLAHELRNPLAPLRNGLEVMHLASNDPAKIEKARGMMQRQLGVMVRLVDDLLDVSRVSRGKIELRLADMELSAALRSAVEASQPLMNERGHTLAARLPAERIVVNGDVARLAQVFSNLLNNAAKYTEPGGRIELDARFADGQVAVHVKDNGIGIPPEMHARVFEIFTQVDRSLERAQGGLGIGLNIARRLVEMHGGTIEVFSEGERKGTEFTVRLPARIEVPRAPEAGAPRSPARLGKRILVADDNPDSAETLQIMLEVMGNEVRVARDGEEAVQAAAEFHPDAILLDIGMPKLNGYDACARIRELPGGREPLIVALTGWSQEEDRARSKEAGFDRHLVKPVEPATLEGIIRTLA
jgi:signal transduction histidine kinase